MKGGGVAGRGFERDPSESATVSLVCWYLYRHKITFEGWCKFERRSHHVLKGATIKRKNMLQNDARQIPIAFLHTSGWTIYTYF